jgi:hypothetical protein
MKRLTLLLAMLLVYTIQSLASDEEAISVAEATASSWLNLTDVEDFGTTWTTASSFFKAAVTESEWEQAITAARRPFGQLKSRELESATFYTTLPGAPDGEYVVLIFSSSFDQKESAVETVTVMLDQSESWRVSGYFIR